LLAVACSTGPPVLRPNDATEFRIEVTTEPLASRDRECRGEPTPGDRPCRLRFSLTVENIGQETADAICFVSIVDPDGEVAWGQGFLIGTLERDQSQTRSGVLGFLGPFGRVWKQRCASYDVGSTATQG
jgi:hypothetical protein